MPGTVDSLNIQISAEATAANTALGNLTTKLNTLSSALNKVNTSGIKSFSSSMTNLTTAMQGMKSVNASQFTKVANGISKLTAVDTAKLSAFTNVMKPLAQAISSLNGLAFDGSSINSLINAITRLSNANISGLNSVNFTQLGNSLKSLINALSGASDVSARTVQITNAIAKLGATGATIGQVAAELPTLGTALRSFISSMSGASAVSTEVISFTTAIASLANAGSKAGTTASNLEALAVALKNFFVTMSSAPAVDSSIISMTNSLANLAAQGSSVKTATNGITTSLSNMSAQSISSSTNLKTLASRLNLFSKSANTAKTSSTSLAAAFGKLFSAVFILKSVFSGISNAIDLSSDLTEVQNVVDVAFGEYKDSIEEFSKTSIENYGINELTAKTIASRYQAMSNAIGLTNDAAASANDSLSEWTDGYVEASGTVADMSVNLTKLAADMGSFYNVDADEVAEDLESVFTGTTKPLRQYGLDLTQATLQEWALKNGLDADISSMTQAEKVMLRYQYVLANTTDAQGDFSRTSDTWANRVRVLKLQLQSLATTLGGAFINALKPALRALNSFMTSVIEIVDNIVNALGKIFGWTIETTNVGTTTDDIADETTDATDDIADGYDDATAAAQEYENTVLGIDELHKLNSTNEDTDSGSGSSGDSGSGTSSSSGYSSAIKQTEGLIDYYKSSINSLYELGEYISETLANALNDIDWNKVYKKAENFGKGLAEFLNGLISPELFSAVGTTIANSLNTVLHALDGFGTTFDWSDFGNSLAAGLNAFLGSIDWDLALKNAKTFGTGIATTLNRFIANTDFSQIGKTIANALNTIITFWLSFGTTFDFKEFGLKIADAINGFFQTFDFASLANSIDAWVQGIFKMIVTALGNISWKDVFKGIGSFLGNLDIGTVAIVIGAVLIKKILSMSLASGALTAVIKGLGSGIASQLAGSIGAHLGVELTGKSITQVLSGAGTSVATTFVAGVRASFGSEAAGAALGFTSPFTLAVTGGASIAAGGFLSAFAIKGMWDKGYNAGDEVKLGIGAALAGVGAVILAPFTGGASIALFTGIAAGIFGGGNLAILIKNNLDEIVQFFKDLPGNIVKAIKGLPKKIGEIIDAVLQWFSELPAKIGYALGYAVGTIVSWVKDMVKKVKEKVPEIIDNVITFFTELPGKVWEWLTEVPGKIADWASDMIETVKEKVPEIIESIKEFFQELPEDFVQFGKDIIDGLWEGITSIWETIGQKWQEFKESFVQGFKDALGIHSPSTVFEELGEMIIEGLKEGILSFDLSEIWEDIKKTAKTKFGNIKTTISTTWDNVKTNTSNKWKNIKSNLGTTWDSVKSNASTKFSGIKTNISTTWDNVKTNTTTKWGTIKSTLSTKWSDIKSNASTKFGNIKTNISTTWDNVKTNTTTKWNTIKSTLSTKWSDIKSNASTKFGNIKTSISTTWDSIKTNAKNKWDGIKTSLSSIWTTIKYGGINAFSTMGTKIKEGFDNLKTSLKKKAAKLGEAVISPIKKLVNGVIKGINWILDKLGSSTTVKEWAGVDFSNYYATGSSGIPQDTIGVVNDQKGSVYKELIVPPTGDAFIPEGRNVTLPLAKGTKILPAAQTAELLKSSMPHFKTGIGDLLGGAWSKIKEFTGNVWDYVSKPKELVQLAIDKFTDISDIASPWTDVAKGAINTTLDNIVDFVKGKFDTAVPSVTYDPSKGVSQWSDLAKYALQLCNQYTAANLSRLLYQMQTESGGNPNAINLWDSNAKKGTPSKGLMQVIDSTFKAYAMKGYNTNIWDPLSNMLAAIRYTVARYGSLTKGWQGHGYSGGVGKISLADIVPKFAAGGFLGNLSAADLLVARENGIPEMVGRIGSQTAVANNDQIAAGIAAAVQPAVYNAMMAANSANRGSGNVELVLEIDGEEIGRVATNYQKLQNKRYTVEPSFV